MLSFFKSSKKKTPKKGKTFYERENFIYTINDLNNCIKHLSSSKNTKTNSNILFQGYELDSIHEKDLEKNFGEESFFLEPDNDIPEHKIYYYRITSQHLRFLIQLHFIDDQFFFAATKVYSDALLSAADKQRVLKQIITKYYPNANEDTIEFDIEDPKGNVLFTQDDVYYYIKYLANNATSQNLKKQYSGYEEPKPGQEIKETLDKLI